MFNGIIFNQGVVTKITKRSKGINLFIKSDLKLHKHNLGVSVACDGVCLTLIAINKHIAEFYLFKSPKNLSKLVAHKDFNCFKYLSQNYKNKKKINTLLGKDSITLYKR